jgi:hypothetical protein
MKVYMNQKTPSRKQHLTTRELADELQIMF